MSSQMLSQMMSQISNKSKSRTRTSSSTTIDASPKKHSPKPLSASRLIKGRKSGIESYTTHRFAECDIVEGILKNIGFEEMTSSQALYLPGILQDTTKSVFVNAGTGSGKTLGFLIPIMNKILRNNTAKQHVSALIITPTGSLANQIYQEAMKLSAGTTGIKVEMIIKDRNVSPRSVIEADIIVATPGRLGKMLSQPDVAQSMSNLDTFVLDEADQLARKDFMQVIGPIIKKYANVQTTQKLFFSATKNAEVEALLAAQSMETITANIVQDMKQTNVQQFYHMYNPMCLHEALKVELEARCMVPEYKILVFLPTRLSVEYFAQVMKAYLSNFEGAPEILVVMGGMNPGTKTVAENRFRNDANAIMFTTDMLARGMDFKQVTSVIMVGACDLDSYKQKVGRTGRAGELGQSVILLGTDESLFLKELKAKFETLRAVSDDVTKTNRCAALPQVDEKKAGKVFKSLRGHYKPLIKVLGWKKDGDESDGKFTVDGRMNARLYGLKNGGE